jgi:membrane dipeptidase
MAFQETEIEEHRSNENEVTPPVFGLIDAHADTISRALRRGQNMSNNDLHIDFERLLEFGSPVQVFAVWLDDKYVNNAHERAIQQIDFFASEIAKHSDIVEAALTLEDIERNSRNKKISAILSLEGAEPLEGKIENLDYFYNRGVRIITLTWNRENELACGVGANSGGGLKPFGVECVKRMEELGIMIDVSHLNEAGFWDLYKISTRPFMASHSNAYSITPHIRNLKDGQIKAIVDRGGIIGINLLPNFHTTGGNASSDSIIKHISHFISLGAGAALGLGCDLDGFDTMPEGFEDVLSLKILADKITGAFDENTSQRIMSGNFYEFFKRFFEKGAKNLCSTCL